MENNTTEPVAYYTLPVNVTDKTELDPLLAYCYDNMASDIFIRTDAVVKIYQHGRLHPVTKRPISRTEIERIIKMIHSDVAMSKLNSQQPLDTHYDVHINREEQYRFRVNAVKTDRGLCITLRCIPDIPPSVEDLNLPQDIIDACDIRYGLGFVVGATGDGKTTTIAALLRRDLELKTAHHHIVTIENPIEYPYHRVNQDQSFINQIEVGTGVKDFTHGIKNAMRMAPTVLLVGESRDLETMEASIEAAKTGHKVYTTVHATDVCQTFHRIIDIFPPALRAQAKHEVIDLTSFILAQRLVPTLDGKREAIREYLVFDQSIRETLRNSQNLLATAALLVEQYGQPFEIELRQLKDRGKINDSTYRQYGGTGEKTCSTT